MSTPFTRNKKNGLKPKAILIDNVKRRYIVAHCVDADWWNESYDATEVESYCFLNRAQHLQLGQICHRVFSPRNVYHRPRYILSKQSTSKTKIQRFNMRLGLFYTTQLTMTTATYVGLDQWISMHGSTIAQPFNGCGVTELPSEHRDIAPLYFTRLRSDTYGVLLNDHRQNCVQIPDDFSSRGFAPAGR